MSLLFTSEEQIKSCLPVTTSFKLAAATPFLQKVQSKEINEALGFDQLKALTDAFTANTLSPEQQALLDAVRVPLASFGIAAYLPHSSVQLTGAGARTAGTEQLKPASPAALAGLTDALTDAGHAGIEALLELLEERRADYPLWAASDACTVLHEEFFTTAKEFDKFVFIDRSRRRFVALQPNIRDVQRLGIRPLLGPELLEELFSQRKTGTLTTVNQTLISYVRPALASLAMKNDPCRQEIGQAYLEELRKFLYEHADDYPTFTASSAYKPDLSTQLQQDANWGFHGLL